MAAKEKEYDPVYQPCRTKLRKGKEPTADVLISDVRND
jgi:hypothetical protein